MRQRSPDWGAFPNAAICVLILIAAPQASGTASEYLADISRNLHLNQMLEANEFEIRAKPAE